MRFLVFMLLISSTCAAQETPATTRISHDTLYLANGLTFVVGDDLHFGLGSNAATKGFNFVYTSPMSLSGQLFLDAGWAGRKMKIKNFKKLGTRRTGDKFYIILGGGNIVNYWCEIDQALSQGEVVDDRIQKDPTPVVTVNQPTSVADEIAKLKKLYDDGVLTKEEFEAQKKKLLGQ